MSPNNNNAAAATTNFRLLILLVLVVALTICYFSLPGSVLQQATEPQPKLQPKQIYRDIRIWTGSDPEKLQPATNASQIVVLGMHHSATSLCTRIIMLMGAYAGEMNELKFHKNPTIAKYKYWERKSAISLNSRLFQISESALNESHKGIPIWSGYHFDINLVKNTAFAKRKFKRRVSKTIGKLNRKRPWVIKEPRMNLLVDLWTPFFDRKFVCVLVYRHPIEIARRMTRYGLEQKDWIELWRNYTLSALKGCEGQPKVIALQSKLGKQPLEFSQQLYHSITKAGVSGLVAPHPDEVKEFLRVNESVADSVALLKYEEIVKKDEDALSLLPTDLDRCLVQLLEKGEPFEHQDMAKLCRRIGLILP